MSQNENRILLVEDNPREVTLARHALVGQTLADSIEVVRDGEEALDYIFCRGKYGHLKECPPPRLVLLDLKLPKINGLEVLQAVKSDPATKAIPVVVLTASNEERDLIDAYRFGANAYIQKPVDFNRFRQILEQTGAFWLGINLTPPAATPLRKKEA